MANLLFPKFLQRQLEGTAPVVWLTDNIKVVLVDGADYAYSASHEFLSDVPPAARTATSGNLGSKTSTNGVADAADITLTSVTGDPSEILIVYKDTGTASTSPLMVYMDTGIGGMPVTPSGGDHPIVWHASGIFSL